jgi:hypothetical protein
VTGFGGFAGLISPSSIGLFLFSGSCCRVNEDRNHPRLKSIRLGCGVYILHLAGFYFFVSIFHLVFPFFLRRRGY